MYSIDSELESQNGELEGTKELATTGNREVVEVAKNCEDCGGPMRKYLLKAQYPPPRSNTGPEPKLLLPHAVCCENPECPSFIESLSDGVLAESKNPVARAWTHVYNDFVLGLSEDVSFEKVRESCEELDGLTIMEMDEDQDEGVVAAPSFSSSRPKSARVLKKKLQAIKEMRDRLRLQDRKNEKVLGLDEDQGKFAPKRHEVSVSPQPRRGQRPLTIEASASPLERPLAIKASVAPRGRHPALKASAAPRGRPLAVKASTSPRGRPVALKASASPRDEPQPKRGQKALATSVSPGTLLRVQPRRGCKSTGA